MDIIRRDESGGDAGRVPSRSSRRHVTSPSTSPKAYEEREDEGALDMLSEAVGDETPALSIESSRGRSRQRSGPAVKGVGGRTAPDSVATTHRAACHRCGNLRKRNVKCPACPQVYCQRCAEKVVIEWGPDAFVDGCPVCKCLCCCNDARDTPRCSRLTHCYKKCPAIKNGQIAVSDDAVLDPTRPCDGGKAPHTDMSTAMTLVAALIEGPPPGRPATLRHRIGTKLVPMMQPAVSSAALLIRPHAAAAVASSSARAAAAAPPSLIGARGSVPSVVAAAFVSPPYSHLSAAVHGDASIAEPGHGGSSSGGVIMLPLPAGTAPAAAAQIQALYMASLQHLLSPTASSTSSPAAGTHGGGHRPSPASCASQATGTPLSASSLRPGAAEPPLFTLGSGSVGSPAAAGNRVARYSGGSAGGRGSVGSGAAPFTFHGPSAAAGAMHSHGAAARARLQVEGGCFGAESESSPSDAVSRREAARCLFGILAGSGGQGRSSTTFSAQACVQQPSSSGSGASGAAAHPSSSGSSQPGVQSLLDLLAQPAAAEEARAVLHTRDASQDSEANVAAALASLTGGTPRSERPVGLARALAALAAEPEEPLSRSLPHSPVRGEQAERSCSGISAHLGLPSGESTAAAASCYSLHVAAADAQVDAGTCPAETGATPLLARQRVFSFSVSDNEGGGDGADPQRSTSCLQGGDSSGLIKSAAQDARRAVSAHSPSSIQVVSNRSGKRGCSSATPLSVAEAASERILKRARSSPTAELDAPGEVDSDCAALKAGARQGLETHQGAHCINDQTWRFCSPVAAPAASRARLYHDASTVSEVSGSERRFSVDSSGPFPAPVVSDSYGSSSSVASLSTSTSQPSSPVLDAGSRHASRSMPLAAEVADSTSPCPPPAPESGVFVKAWCDLYASAFLSNLELGVMAEDVAHAAAAHLADRFYGPQLGNLPNGSPDASPAPVRVVATSIWRAYTAGGGAIPFGVAVQMAAASVLGVVSQPPAADGST